MKLLLDGCISWTVRDELQAAGHDVVWTGDWPEDPGDEEILASAHREDRVLITLDKDFGELAVVRGEAHAGIVRLVNWPIARQASACRTLIDRYGAELQAGALITAEPGRVRIRP